MGGGLRGGRLRRPGRLILAAGTAAGRAHRALRASRDVRVAQALHGAPGCRTRAR